MDVLSLCFSLMQFFSYNHDTGHCFLWNANVTLVKHHVDTSKQNVSWTAGPRSCDGNVMPPSPHPHPQVNFCHLCGRNLVRNLGQELQ